MASILPLRTDTAMLTKRWFKIHFAALYPKNSVLKYAGNGKGFAGGDCTWCSIVTIAYTCQNRAIVDSHAV